MKNKFYILIISIVLLSGTAIAETNQKVLYSITSYDGETKQILVVEDSSEIDKLSERLKILENETDGVKNEITSVNQKTVKFEDHVQRTIKLVEKLRNERNETVKLLEASKADYNKLKERQQELENSITTNIFIAPQIFTALIVIFVLLIIIVAMTIGKKYTSPKAKVKKTRELDQKTDLQQIKGEIVKEEKEDDHGDKSI